MTQTVWQEIDALVALTIKRAIDSDAEWIERELERMLPLWDWEAWGPPSLAFRKGKFLGLTLASTALGGHEAVLMSAERS
jgi:hypothetical protein